LESNCCVDWKDWFGRIGMDVGQIGEVGWKDELEV
jgi:hypothetical protein